MTAYAQDSSKPWVVRLVCGLGILYVLSPLDFLPDLMPIIGWVDDILVVTGVLGWMIQQWKRWQQKLRLQTKGNVLQSG
jgi:uncharacterized membrane protein YkvA (DUF1232 family)